MQQFLFFCCTWSI